MLNAHVDLVHKHVSIDVLYILYLHFRSRKAARRTRVPNKQSKAENGQARGAASPSGKDADNNNAPGKRDIFATSTETKERADTKHHVEREAKQTPERRNENGTENFDRLDRLDDQNESSYQTMNSTLNGKPKTYEPNEREKDLLASLEMSTITIETDPEDPNRYFKKMDTGDWYRVIMKGKKPRKDKKADKYKESDVDEGNNRHSHKSRKSRDKRSKSDFGDTLNDTSKSRKSRSGKSRSLNRSLDRTDDKHSRSASKGNSSAKKNRSRRRRSKDDYLSDESDFNDTANSRLIKSQPLHQAKTVQSKPASDSRLIQSQPIQPVKPPTVIQSRPTSGIQTNPTSVTQSKPTQVVQAKPKEPDPPKARIIMSNPSPVLQPARSHSDSVKDLANDINNVAGNKVTNYRQTANGSAASMPAKTQPSPTPQRSSLFGGKSGGEQTTHATSRPEIVPPLNLKGAGDQVELEEIEDFD